MILVIINCSNQFMFFVAGSGYHLTLFAIGHNRLLKYS